MDADALDFWLGTWACTWEGGHGTNTVTREFDGRVVQERFEAIEPEPFSGLSVSVHDGDTWRQTWVDSSGSYWAFVGEQEGDTVIFETPVQVDADQVFKRMVFSNITADGFDWRWEFSPDRTSWEPRWELRYRRLDAS